MRINWYPELIGTVSGIAMRIDWYCVVGWRHCVVGRQHCVVGWRWGVLDRSFTFTPAPIGARSASKLTRRRAMRQASCRCTLLPAQQHHRAAWRRDRLHSQLPPTTPPRRRRHRRVAFGHQRHHHHFSPHQCRAGWLCGQPHSLHPSGYGSTSACVGLPTLHMHTLLFSLSLHCCAASSRLTRRLGLDD
eukprot:SAG11_NODE_806_length_7093_cov_1.965379_5_plen_189_part_00